MLSTGFLQRTAGDTRRGPALAGWRI